MRHQLRWAATTVAVAIVMLLAGVVFVGVASQPATAAPAAQTSAPRTITLYGPTAVTTGTTYSSAPLTVQGNDLARITNYKNVDVFVATDANSSGYLTVTLQASPDEIIWTDAADIVQTFNTTGTLISNVYTYTKSLAGSTQTGMLKAPLAGEFLRVKVAVTGNVTPTVMATLR